MRYQRIDWRVNHAVYLYGDFMKIPTTQEARQLAYDAIKSAGGWINLDDLVKKINLNRKDLRMVIASISESPHFGNIKKRSKREDVKHMGQTKPIYNIDYRYIGDSDD